MTTAADPSIASAAEDAALARALDGYLAAVEAGRPVDPESLLAAHPEVADRLRRCLDSLGMIGRAADALAGREADPARPGATLGDFRILREVGRGGMGVVYEAEQVSLGRRVALKVLPFAAAVDPARLARFQLEARAAAGLHAAHVVPVHAVGCERGVHYYAMQFIDGRSLADLIRERTGTPKPRGRAEFEEAARWGVQAAGALEQAHRAGILHRDVKPANLLVDGRGDLWVTDFGLARLDDDGDLTRTGDLPGTLRYMSPERAAGRRAGVDRRTDVYSLGLTLYELLTLSPAHDGDRHEILRRIAAEEPRRPREVAPAIPRDLETVVLKAIAKDPARRYATAGDLADDLRRFLADEPIRARRPGPAARAGRWAWRHREAVAVAAAVLALAAAGLAVGSVLLWREATRAEANLTLALRALDEFCDYAGEAGFDVDPARGERARRSALALYERLAGQPPAGAGARFETAHALRRIGDIRAAAWFHAGQRAEAEAAYRSADALLSGLLARDPRDPAARAEAALVLGRRGALIAGYDLGRVAEAEPILRRGLALARGLAAESPGRPEHREAVARGCLDLYGALTFRTPAGAAEKERLLAEALALREGGADAATPAGRLRVGQVLAMQARLLDMTRRPAEAARTTARAAALADALAGESPADPTRRHAVAALMNQLLCYEPCGAPVDPADVERAYLRALAARDRLAADFPAIADFRAELAWSHLALGGLYLRHEKPAEAEAEYRASIALGEGLVSGHPGVDRYRTQLLLALVALGETCQYAGRPADALPPLRRALGLDPTSASARRRLDRAQAATTAPPGAPPPTH